jgi:hypothetical protein
MRTQDMVAALPGDEAMGAAIYGRRQMKVTTIEN